MKFNITLLLLLFRVFGWIIATRSTMAVLALSSINTPLSISKLEKAAISRFKNSHDKLCKTCPALLQPKVDTLTEMVVGLSPEDRQQLFQAVSLRLQQQQKQQQHDVSSFSAVVKTRAEDVDKFQKTRANVTVHPANDELAPERSIVDSETTTTRKDDDVDEKVREKMNKLRSKYESNKNKLSQVQALLEQTNRLLAQKAHARSLLTNAADDTNDHYISQIIDPVVLHKTLELQEMSYSELEMQRLKYMAQKMKYEQKMAKSKLKLYQTSLRSCLR
jgi:hypothetical protein